MKDRPIASLILVAGFAAGPLAARETGVDPATEEQASARETAEPTKAAESDAPAEGDVAGHVAVVTISAGRLQDAFKRLEDALTGAGDRDTRLKALDEMLAAARGVNESLNRDSETWQDLSRLEVEWTGKRDDMNERAKANPALLGPAQQWQDKLDRVAALRNAFLDQVTDADVLISDIEAQREVVAASCELDRPETMRDGLETRRSEAEAALDRLEAQEDDG